MGFSDRDELKRRVDEAKANGTVSHWTFVDHTPESEVAPPEEWVELGPMTFESAIYMRPGLPDVVIDLRQAAKDKA